MATAIKQDIAGETARMHDVLAAQKASFTAAMPESLAVRSDRIDRAIALLVDNAEEFAKAVHTIFAGFKRIFRAIAPRATVDIDHQGSRI